MKKIRALLLARMARSFCPRYRNHKPYFYSDWSRHALKQYEKHADVKAYVKAFENILENSFCN